MRKTLGQLFGCDNQNELVNCIKKYNNIPYEVACEDKIKGGKTMLKIVVERVESSDEFGGMFNCPNTKESFCYERRRDDKRLVAVSSCMGTDRDTNDVEYVKLLLSEDELLFIDEQLKAKDVESLLPHLSVNEIIEYDKKYSPIHEAVTFKCDENDSEITAHLYADNRFAKFTVRYFSTFDNQNISLELELDSEVKKRLKKEILTLIKEMEAKEKVSI